MRRTWWRHFLTVVLGLAVIRSAAAENPPSNNAVAPVTLCLSATEPDFKVANSGGRLLVREILRQSILVAARDQLGLPTRDMALRETIPGTANDLVQPLDVLTAESTGQFVRMRLTRGSGEQAVVIYEKEIPLPLASDNTFDYLGLVAAAEQLSRTEITDALGKAGFQGQPNRADATIALPTATRKRLAEMNFFSQFAALRDLHALQRDKGESPHTLGALVRTYANLGQLTKFHWNASHKVFKARALLYAQRLVDMESQSPWSLRHRAYAATLAGLHAAALKDLKSATERAGSLGEKSSNDDTSRAAPWEPLITALCTYDSKALQQAAVDADLGEFAALCSYLLVENSNCESLTLMAGRKALEAVPECYAICDSMGRYSGVINRHTTTVQGPLVLGETYKDRLRAMSDLPELVKEELLRFALGNVDAHPDPAWAGGSQRASLVKSLAKAGAPGRDATEPSWELLARLLEDVTLVHVYRRLEFFHDGLGLPAESYHDQLETAYAAVADHPYLPILKATLLNPQRDVQQIVTLYEAAKPVDVELTLYPVQRRVSYASSSRLSIRTRLWDAMWRHTDMVADDLEQMAYYAQNRDLARQLMLVSPHSPQAIALLVMYDHDFARPKMNEWERDYGDQAVVVKALASRYTQLGQSVDAERCLKRYVELSPDQWGFQALADVYWKQKQPEKWKEALDESLKHEDFALSHAQTQVKVARYFMERKEWEKAAPYANAAAQTGAAWAMMCAADCYEGLEMWNQSEELMRATAERYPGSQFDWFFWCCRTGHGDSEAARKLAMQYAPRLSLNASPYDWDHLGVYHLLSGKNELARKAFTTAFERSGNPYSAVHLALLADSAGDAEARDKALAGAVDRGPKYQSPGGVQTATIEFSKWLNNAYHQPTEATPNVEALEDVLKMTNAAEQANIEYFAARYFHDHGHLDLARKYLQKCVDTMVTQKWNYALSCELLRELPANEAGVAAAQGADTDEQ